ncbi:MAG: hypothetical protein LBS48_01285 [Treponema sp.]|jgi:L-fucose isomerase-like protein|nr:hypothetical protein [Treponema sp.]
MEKITFALFFGNRGFFPGELIADARKELTRAVEAAGYGYILMDEGATRYGAVETREEGRKYAAFLKANAGKYQGVILCMPNFSDENGAQAALSDAGVPILVQAYRDMPGKLDFAHRRDSMCGKFAMCNVLRQCGIKYTIIPPFTVDPGEAVFKEHIEAFAGICRTAAGMKRTNIGAIGARTTAFKTVRVDEIGLQNHGVNIESFDLSSIFRLMNDAPADRIAAKKKKLLEITEFKHPEAKLDSIARFGVTVDKLIEEYDLHAVAIRCWDELELAYGVAPCLILCELNERGIAAACEVDVSNAVFMRALTLASGRPVALLDINNNFGMDDTKSILFHCGPVPISLLKAKGTTEEHLMFKKSYGPGSGVGINKGEFRTGLDITFGSAKTENGKICTFLGEGRLTSDDIEKEFFGVGVVMEHPRMQEIAEYIGREGYRHHMSLTEGKTAWAVREALVNYLGYEVHSF